MSSIKSSRSLAVAVMFAVFMAVTSVDAATISQNFEGETLGSTTPPTGWSLVSVNGTSSYVVTAGNGGGLAGQITGNHTSNGSTIPAGYVVNNGGVAFDTTQPISGTFDFYIPEAGNYSSALFMIGDIQTGITQTTSGEWLGMLLRERTFGARAQLTAGDGSTLFDGVGNNQYQIETDQWYAATFDWTPTAGKTGNFSFSWTGAQGAKGPMNVTGYTFDSEQAWFGFGTGGYFSGDHSGRFDNISITGTEFVNFNMEVSGSVGNWTIDNNGGSGEFFAAGAAGSVNNLNTLALQETANDLGPFDVEITVESPFIAGPETVAITKSVTNNSGKDWASFSMEVGTGTGDNFVPLDDALLSILSTPAATETTGAFPNVSLVDGLLEFTGLLTQGATAEFQLAIQVDDLVDGNANGQAIFTLRQTAAQVPEPTSLGVWSLLGLGLAGLGYNRSRGRKK